MSNDLKISNLDFVIALSYTFPEFLQIQSCVSKYLDAMLEETDAEKQLTVLLLLESGLSYYKIMKYLEFKTDAPSVKWSKETLEQVKDEGAFHLEMLDSVRGH